MRYLPLFGTMISIVVAFLWAIVGPFLPWSVAVFALIAIESGGYDPFRIAEADFLNPITDKIIAEIRRSRFLVADFTHGTDGARGSVYYEAGFAHGLNIPVIFTAQEGTKPHFDMSTYPHIFWNPDNLPAFRSDLTEHIMKLEELGPGPRLP